MLIDNLTQAFVSGINASNPIVSTGFLLLYAILVMILASVFAYLFGWLERKIIAKAQYRHGPTYVGKFGILQNLADLVKLLAKEAVVPENADKLLLAAAPIILVAVNIFIIFLLPLSASVQASNFGLGLLAVIVLLGFTPLLLFVTGFASGNKLSAIGAQRSVLMLIGYEVPLVIVLASVAIAAHTFSLSGIIAAQSSLPYAVLIPIGFVVFFIIMLAEMERPPFDLREADSELIAGWLTDISAHYYALALLLDYMRMFMGSLLIAILFLGGWSGPLLPGIAWLIIKAFLVSLFIILIRATVVRMRIDKILRLGWVYLLPLSLINLILVFILFK